MANGTANLAVLMDFYELTMAASYLKHKPDCLASFDLFIRNLPKERSFFLAAGLADAVDFLKNFCFEEEDLAYLDGLNVFDPDFLDYLGKLRFTGDLWAMPEGTVFFPNEPVMRVVAPLIEAQLLESFLLNTVNLQTTIATKAARVVLAAKGRNVFDFSLRRTHGADAALKVARSAYIAGFNGTSNVLAGKRYGIPVVGTMAHSFVMSFSNELASFRAFIDTFPKYSTLLVDTYDTSRGVQNAIVIAKELEVQGKRLMAIRLDSGSLTRLSARARFLLDRAGLSYVKILASGNLDEYAIKELMRHGAPIDSFGVGTKMGVSEDAPYSDVIYKLSEITDINGDFLPTMKLSHKKMTYPGRKQVFRFADRKGMFKKDVVGLDGEDLDGTPLLVKIIDHGTVVYNQPSLKEIRNFAAVNLSRLPKSVAKLKLARKYPVVISPKLTALTERVAEDIRKETKQ